MASLPLVPEHPVDSQSSRGPGTAVPLRPGPGSVQQDEPSAPRPPPRRSSQEIANLESAEAALDAMGVSYHKDREGRKLYETMLDGWKSDELRLVADRVGTINAKGAKCSKVMRDPLRTKAELQEVVEFLKNPTKFERLGGKMTKGILLTGEPGTGQYGVGEEQFE
jgi:hypothetical protein